MKAALENDAQNFQREMTELRDQLKIALDALNQKEAIRNGFMENAARQNVQLEAVVMFQHILGYVQSRGI